MEPFSLTPNISAKTLSNLTTKIGRSESSGQADFETVLDC